MILIGLEAYAVLLAWLQGGIRTDEAKYLLSIPYPHPPLARWFLSLFDGFTWQAGVARILFASLVVQAVRIVWKMAGGMPRLSRYALAAAWLFSWGVLSQAGAVMMAPLTALQGLLFLWLSIRDDDATPFAGVIALFWMASLFTAYQAALFFPIVLAILWKTKLPAWQRLALFFVPVFLLGLYTFTNPFALASMLNQAGKDGALSLAGRATAFAWLWFAAGSGALSVAGMAGLFFSKRRAIIVSFLLVCGYIFVGFHGYYGIILVPFFAVGLADALRAWPRLTAPFATCFLVGTCALLFFHLRLPSASVAHVTMREIEQRGRQGDVLIQGSFGHEWQYESPYPVLKYGEWLLENARAVVCLKADACEVRGAEGFEKMEGMPVEVWVRE